MLPQQYTQELDDETFRLGELKGRLTTSVSILTDSLLMVNALEVYYQKPASKAVSPAELEQLRSNLASVKELLREIINMKELPATSQAS